MNKESIFTSSQTLVSRSKVSELILKAQPFVRGLLLVAIWHNNNEFAVFICDAGLWNKSEELKSVVLSIINGAGGLYYEKK
jgi:hypothetical protein